MLLSEVRSGQFRKHTAPRCSVARGAARVASVLAVLAGAGLIAGCGGSSLQPLYGQSASGKPMTDVLANLDISLIPGRTGQVIRNELLFFKSGGAAPTNVGAEYRLEIAIREYTQSVLVANSGLAGGAVLSIDASFKLYRVKDGKIAYQGNAYARAPYEVNRVTDPLGTGTSTGRSVFNNVRAARDGQDRAAHSLAQDIRTRVAAYLSGAA